MFGTKFVSGPTTDEEVNLENEYFSTYYRKQSDASLENIIREQQMCGNYYGNECRLAEIELRRRNHENRDN